MDEGLVFDFDGVDREQYDDARLGLDSESEEDDCPVCPRFRSGAAKPAAGVFEVWETPGCRGSSRTSGSNRRPCKFAIAASARVELLNQTSHVAPGA